MCGLARIRQKIVMSQRGCRACRCFRNHSASCLFVSKALLVVVTVVMRVLKDSANIQRCELAGFSYEVSRGYAQRCGESEVK